MYFNSGITCFLTMRKLSIEVNTCFKWLINNNIIITSMFSTNLTNLIVAFALRVCSFCM